MFALKDWIFSLKLFVAGMSAFATAASLGLEQPYWALVTCCVLMNPFSGAIRSKAVFRFAGTLCAGLVSLLIAALFGSTPLLLIIFAGLFATLSFALAALDRTPRAYGFQLFSLTLMLVAVAGVDHPESMFSVVISRLTEVGLGILATTLIDGLFPMSHAKQLQASLARWLPDMRHWAEAVLDGELQQGAVEHERIKTLADIAALSQLNAQLRYDPMLDKRDLKKAVAIQRRLLAMVPLLSGISSRVASLDEHGRALLEPFLEEARHGLHHGQAAAADYGSRLHGLAESQANSLWQKMIFETLADMLEEMLDYWHGVNVIDQSLKRGDKLDRQLNEELNRARPFPLPIDIDHAMRMAAGVLCTYSIICVVWYFTGWNQGANMAILGTVAIAFFGGVDEPGVAIATFGRFACLALFLSALLCYGLLPMAEDFVSFVMVMAVFMLPIGAWAATNPLATLVMALGLSNINLQGHYSPFAFNVYLEAAVASLMGIYAAFLCASLFRPWGAEKALQRTLKREMKDIVGLSRRASPRARDIYINHSLDRVAMTAARLTSAWQKSNVSVLSVLRVGANVATLRIHINQCEGESRLRIEALLSHFGRELNVLNPPASLLADIDAALAMSLRVNSGHSDRVVRALSGLRLAMFHQVPLGVEE
ncbi:putative membrane protein [Spongiibacter sp. IMCC21906]|uniref:FUSC family protein n=1 Tax=Spongiibacter sp. IMCC21906 TaxID=1620392 RepID=UPI00062DED44|nr:FUSC family protein [Spongiibacter sp. IMCC21906]AKH70142.1 putative membrane protein [Spongiibacter sp. IMCC21906]